MSRYSTRFAGEEIDNCRLGEWLEDEDRFARYEVVSVDGIAVAEQSDWLCTECGRFAHECECGDNLAEDLGMA